jgi:hypothetical protein
MRRKHHSIQHPPEKETPLHTTPTGEGNTTPYNTHLRKKHHSIQHPPEEKTLLHTTRTSKHISPVNRNTTQMSLHTNTKNNYP